MLSKTGGENPQAEGGLPRRRGQLLDRHHRRRRDEREQEDRPLKVERRSDQSGARSGTETRIAAQTARPDHRPMVQDRRGTGGSPTTLATIGDHEDEGDDSDASPVDAHFPAADPSGSGSRPAAASRRSRRRCTSRRPAATNASRTESGLTPAIHIIVVVVSPTTLPEPPAFDAATIAGEVPDMDLPAKNARCDRAPDQRRGDVIEEGRQHEDHPEQDESALPVVGQDPRDHDRHLRILEVLREEREAHEQAEEVREDHPLMGKEGREAGEARALGEPGERKLVDRDGDEPADRDLEGLVVEERRSRRGSARRG
jgi:hypothetical protein